MTLTETHDALPPWVNWTIIFGAAAASWLAPLASLIAIVYGGLQIYAWFEKRRNRKWK